MSVLHEHYVTESTGDTVLFRCKECGCTSMSLGALHAHIEKHRGYTRFNIQIPFTETAMANGGELWRRTEIVRVADTETVSRSEVEGL